MWWMYYWILFEKSKMLTYCYLKLFIACSLGCHDCNALNECFKCLNGYYLKKGVCLGIYK